MYEEMVKIDERFVRFVSIFFFVFFFFFCSSSFFFSYRPYFSSPSSFGHISCVCVCIVTMFEKGDAGSPTCVKKTDV